MLLSSFTEQSVACVFLVWWWGEYDRPYGRTVGTYIAFTSERASEVIFEYFQKRRLVLARFPTDDDNDIIFCYSFYFLVLHSTVSKHSRQFLPLLVVSQHNRRSIQYNMRGDADYYSYAAENGMPRPYHHQQRSNTAATATTPTDGLGAVGAVAGSLFTKENVNTVTKAVGSQLGALKHQAEEGDSSLRVLALLGGIILLVVGSMECVSKIMLLRIPGALIEFYSLLVGFMIIILESKNFFLSDRFQGKIFKFALFLKFLWGRGCMYFVVGTMQLYHMDLFNFIAGGYMCCLGVLMIFVGQRTAYKLKNMRRSLYSQDELHTKFAQCDLDGDGGLDLQQFRMLANQLGLDMTRRETEAAFNHINMSGDKLTYEAFYSWWTSTELEENIDERGFSFV